MPIRADLALDGGCGSGDLSLGLTQYARHVVGVDISPSMIALAKKRQAEQNRNNVNFVVADLENLPLGEETFDFVVSLETLHHTRLEVVLPGLRRLVKPGGRMVIRDVVTSNSRWDTSPIWQVFCALMSAPGLAVSHGLRTMWRVVSFRMNPVWIRHVCREDKLTPESFRDTYERFLPGCRIESDGGLMTVFWVDPRGR